MEYDLRNLICQPAVFIPRGLETDIYLAPGTCVMSILVETVLTIKNGECGKQRLKNRYVGKLLSKPNSHNKCYEHGTVTL